MRRQGTLSLCRLLLLLVLLASLVDLTEADSVLTIVSKMKSLRDGIQAVFQKAGKSLSEDELGEDAVEVENWSYSWLSMVGLPSSMALGLDKGLTGLSKDFVFNYLGRDAYHSKNGALIRAMATLSDAMPRDGKAVGAQGEQEDLRHLVLDVCNEGMRLFATGGPLFTMLLELKALLRKDTTVRHLVSALKGTSQLHEALNYFAGPAPGSVAETKDEL
eukprot:TRINITY_DN7246_c0_g1_i1.p1 TRINITY_DN7246_c0_g1~~TRINITY_DN7246_c0_g1_i1.p1  ORF type:complete len:218 (-),score=58.22 TRINITY_DN7246_c0_g1_i1:273-926(-)